MKISVVMATYNGEHYIVEQLKSLAEQSRQADEVLILDDCSTDLTVSSIHEFISSNNLSSWKVITNRRNNGWRRNFWKGIQLAKGDLIFLCDQDDIWDLKKIELMSNVMERNTNIDLLASNYTKFFSNGKQKKSSFCDKLICQKIYYNIFNILLPGCTYCVKQSFIKRIEKYWTPDTAHDEFLWRYALFSNSLYLYPSSLILWRKHENSAWSIQGKISKNINSRLEWCNYSINKMNLLEEYIEQNDNSNPLYKEIINGNRKWILNRKKFYETRKISYAIKLLLEMKYYNSFKQYVGDLYITFIKRSYGGDTY